MVPSKAQLERDLARRRVRHDVSLHLWDERSFWTDAALERLERNPILQVSKGTLVSLRLVLSASFRFRVMHLEKECEGGLVSAPDKGEEGEEEPTCVST